jgi:hypothetical protein
VAVLVLIAAEDEDFIGRIAGDLEGYGIPGTARSRIVVGSVHLFEDDFVIIGEALGLVCIQGAIFLLGKADMHQTLVLGDGIFGRGEGSRPTGSQGDECGEDQRDHGLRGCCHGVQLLELLFYIGLPKG